MTAKSSGWHIYSCQEKKCYFYIAIINLASYFYIIIYLVTFTFNILQVGHWTYKLKDSFDR